jgi:hypothetical protein
MDTTPEDIPTEVMAMFSKIFHNTVLPSQVVLMDGKVEDKTNLVKKK